MVLQGILRQARLQYNIRRDVIILGGLGLLAYNTDNLLLQRVENSLRSSGLLHYGSV